jgi:hypothetical protein
VSRLARHRPNSKGLEIANPGRIHWSCATAT